MQFGIILYPGVQPIDVIGPWEVFTIWNGILKAPIDLHLISETLAPVVCTSQIVLKPHLTFADCPKLDYLVVPGGAGRIEQIHNSNLISFIQKKAAECKKVLSVCTGMFLLAQAGLLKGKVATTYWRAIPELKKLGVEVAEERLVKSGAIWTSGGFSSGIDLALALIEEIGGKKVAGQVQLLFEYFPERNQYASQGAYKSLPDYQGAQGLIAAKLPRYIEEEIQ